MSYNTKYILNYCNKDRIPLRVELQVWDYIGEQFILVNDDHYLQNSEGEYVVENIDGFYVPERDKNVIEGGSNPFTLTYQNDIGKKGGCIRATSADMEFFENLLFNIDDLATTDETEIRCIFYYDNEIEWIGFVYPDFFNVEITENPLINLTASDRVGALKLIDYDIQEDIEDKITYLDILIKCLKQTGLALNVNVVCGMYCDEIPNASPDDEFEGYEKVNPLESAFVSEWRIYKDIEKKEVHDCYSVIKAILAEFNCLLTQYKGEWWIVNKYEQELGYGIRFYYDSEGNFISINREVFPETHFNKVDVGGERVLHPAGAKNTILLDNGQDMIYPLNYSLESESSALSSIDYWTPKVGSVSEMSYNIPSVYNPNGLISDTYENEIRELKINEFAITVLSNDTENFTPVPTTVIGNSYILESQKFNVVTLDKKKSSFNVNVKGVGKALTAIMIGIFMEIEKEGFPGVKYYFSLQNEVASNGRDFTGNNRFLLVSDINTSGSISVYPFGFENKFNSMVAAVEQEWNLDINISKGADQTYDINTAKFFIRVYPNAAYKKNSGYNDDLTDVITTLKNITITFKNDNQNPKGTVFQSKLTEGKFTSPTETQTAFFGDYQTFGQNGYFYKYREDSLSIHYNASGDRLQNWYTKTDNSRHPLLLHSLRQFTYSYGKAHDILSNIGFDINRINPLSRFAIRCFSTNNILVNNDYLQNGNNQYITATIGKYLNSKRFVFVEGKIDYLRSHFTGVLAQIRTNSVDKQEFIYSYFEQGDIS